MKLCRKCNLEKIKDDFSSSEFKKTNSRCKQCVRDYYIVNKKKCAELNRNNYLKNKKHRLISAKVYYVENKECILQTRRSYVCKNKEKLKENSKDYYLKNKDKILKRVKAYSKNNKDQLNKKRQENKKNKRATLPHFRLKENVSASVYTYLKNKGLNKGNSKLLNYVPWTIDELVVHIESLFEYWMNWSNQGLYIIEEWDDNDPLTWKWQLDHIIPHSSFNYSTMDSEEFRSCWSLNNLRPYSAKCNILDGCRKALV